MTGVVRNPVLPEPPRGGHQTPFCPHMAWTVLVSRCLSLLVILRAPEHWLNWVSTEAVSPA